MQSLVEQVIELFNQSQYYEAHELLEKYWNQLHEDDYKKLIQGIIQCAAALHLLQEKRLVGATKVWLRAQKNLVADINNRDNLDIDKLIQDMYKIFDGFEVGAEINVKIFPRSDL